MDSNKSLAKVIITLLTQKVGIDEASYRSLLEFLFDQGKFYTMSYLDRNVQVVDGQYFFPSQEKDEHTDNVLDSLCN